MWQFDMERLPGQAAVPGAKADFATDFSGSKRELSSSDEKRWRRQTGRNKTRRTGHASRRPTTPKKTHRDNPKVKARRWLQWVDGDVPDDESLSGGARRLLDAADSEGLDTLLEQLEPHAEALERLLNSKCGKYGNSLVHHLVASKEEEDSEDRAKCLKILALAGADVDAFNAHGYAPLHLAAANGYALCCKALNDCGSNRELVSTDEQFQTTAVHFAVEMNEDDGPNLSVALHTLLKCGADPNSRSPSNETPLMIAVQYGDKACVKVLLETQDEEEAVQLEDIDASDSNGWTALHFAADNGERRIMRILLERGADTIKKNDDGDTALSMVCKRLDGEDAGELSMADLEACKELLEAWVSQKEIPDEESESDEDWEAILQREEAQMEGALKRPRKKKEEEEEEEEEEETTTTEGEDAEEVVDDDDESDEDATETDEMDDEVVLVKRGHGRGGVQGSAKKRHKTPKTQGGCGRFNHRPDCNCAWKGGSQAGTRKAAPEDQMVAENHVAEAAQHVKDTMQRLGINQAAICRQLHISASNASVWLAGKNHQQPAATNAGVALLRWANKQETAGPKKRKIKNEAAEATLLDPFSSSQPASKKVKAEATFEAPPESAQPGETIEGLTELGQASCTDAAPLVGRYISLYLTAEQAKPHTEGWHMAKVTSQAGCKGTSKVNIQWELDGAKWAGARAPDLTEYPFKVCSRAVQDDGETPVLLSAEIQPVPQRQYDDDKATPGGAMATPPAGVPLVPRTPTCNRPVCRATSFEHAYGVCATCKDHDAVLIHDDCRHAICEVCATQVDRCPQCRTPAKRRGDERSRKWKMYYPGPAREEEAPEDGWDQLLAKLEVNNRLLHAAKLRANEITFSNFEGESPMTVVQLQSIDLPLGVAHKIVSHFKSDGATVTTEGTVAEAT